MYRQEGPDDNSIFVRAAQKPALCVFAEDILVTGSRARWDWQRTDCLRLSQGVVVGLLFSARASFVRRLRA